MKTRKEYISPVVDIVNIETEHVLLAGSPDTSLTDHTGESQTGKPETETGSGGGPGAKPYTPWDDDNSEW